MKPLTVQLPLQLRRPRILIHSLVVSLVANSINLFFTTSPIPYKRSLNTLLSDLDPMATAHCNDIEIGTMCCKFYDRMDICGAESSSFLRIL